MTPFRIAALAALAAATLVAASPANALTVSECSAKYQAAQKAGTLKGMNWQAFRKAECGTSAAAAPIAATPDDASEPTPATTEMAAEPEAPTMTAPKSVVFPKAVDKKYSSESPGKARMHTCLDQYRASKAADKLGGLKWIQKGGGYYSLCNTKLKA
jgi:hypothetical protein